MEILLGSSPSGACGLPAALSAYCEEFSDVRGLLVSCEADESVSELSPGVALSVYRIAQEAIGNAAKHSQAMQIEVRLSRSDGRVWLSLSDDGVGCASDQIRKSGGLGVINMRERVLQLDGTFQFGSTPGQGTTVRVIVPFRSVSEAAVFPKAYAQDDASYERYSLPA
jgi:signal transduction histidine kinase